MNFDYRVPQDGANFDPAKGDVYAIGGTTTDQLVSTQLPKIEAAIASGRTYDLVYIVSGYNDQVASVAKSEATANNIFTAANRLRAAGVRLVVLCGVFPKAGSSAHTDDCNTRLRIYASVTPGVAFCDLTRVMADQTSPSNVFKFKGTDNTYLGYSVDGTHASGYARRMIARELEPFHRAIARRRIPRRGFNSGRFDQVDTPGADVTGDAGNMTVAGDGGLYNDASFTTNLAGNGNDGCMRLITNANTANGVVATPSIVTGADGFKKQRLSLSGAAGGIITLGFYRDGANKITNLNNGVLTRAYDAEMLIDLNGVSGLGEITMRTGAQSSDTPLFGGNTVADLWPDLTTEQLFIYSTVPETFAVNSGNPGPQIFFQFNTRAPAGSIDISRMSLKRVSD